MEIWNQGSVYINALRKNMQGTEIAKYITKYISKALKVESKAENINNYQLYKERGLINKKRYNCSRGLFRPFTRKLDIDNPTMALLYRYLIEHRKEENIYFKEYYNEHRGNIQILSIQINENLVKDLKHFIILLADENIDKYKIEEIIDWEKLKKIREKQIQDMILYDIEKYYLYELGKYQKVTGLKVG